MLISGLLAVILKTVALVIHYVLVFYTWVVFASVIISWIRPAPSNDIIRTILTTVIRLTEPIFSWVRKRLPQSLFASGLDFTPMIILLALVAADTLIVGSLFEVIRHLRQVGPVDSFQHLQQFQQ